MCPQVAISVLAGLPADDRGRADTRRISASVGDGTPAEFVLAWADVVLNHRDWAMAMRAATPELRLATAQQFIVGASPAALPQIADWSRDAAADELAGVNTGHPLWDTYAAAFLDSFEAFRGSRLAVGTRQRPIDIDHERVVLIDYDNSPYETQVIDGEEMRFRKEGLSITGWPLVVRRMQDGWLLASYGETLPQPGWPPILD